MAQAALLYTGVVLVSLLYRCAEARRKVVDLLCKASTPDNVLEDGSDGAHVADKHMQVVEDSSCNAYPGSNTLVPRL